jgi:hypothetical protein
MRIEKFDPVPIRVENIDELSTPAHAMPTRPAFDARAHTQRTGDIAEMQQVVRVSDCVREMVQAGANSIRENDVVRIAFALQPYAPQVLSAVLI